MKKITRIVTWNAKGLLNRIHELEIFLGNEEIDVCLLSETHFTKLSYVKIKGYNAYHAIHPLDKSRGGSSILIKDTIKHHEILKIETLSMQVMAIQTQLGNKIFNISTIYCPPNRKLERHDFQNLL